MDSHLLNIDNAKCEYFGDEPFVLNIHNLKLERGKLYFLLGKSGSGKSTLLEAIGLMNNTFSNQYKSIDFHHKNQKIDLKKIWRNEQQISRFRESNLAFIFQSTNLMDHFTVGENMSFGMMLNGVTADSAKPKVKELMKAIHLEDSVFDKLPVNISGGQKQRAAFVRAITAPFELLLGDEPTGNLDESTANDLMKVLKNEIVSRDKCGIIVSHNIDQALQFADFIYYVNRNKKSGEWTSSISEAFCLQRNEDRWHDNQTLEISDPRNFLMDQIKF